MGWLVTVKAAHAATTGVARMNEPSWSGTAGVDRVRRLARAVDQVVALFPNGGQASAPREAAAIHELDNAIAEAQDF